MQQGFLPITREEMLERGWEQVDFVYVSGDAYVDHPSFGHAIITRVLEANGYKIGMIVSRIGKTKKVLQYLENQGSVFLFPAEIWIPW